MMNFFRPVLTSAVLHTQPTDHIRIFLYICITVWAVRKLFLVYWRTTHNGYIDSVVPGPAGWPVVGNTLQAIPMKPPGLAKFHDWTTIYPIMMRLDPYFQQDNFTCSFVVITALQSIESLKYKDECLGSVDDRELPTSRRRVFNARLSPRP